MVKISHILTEDILVTSSFSTAFVVPSHVRCIAVTGVIIVQVKRNSVNLTLCNVGYANSTTVRTYFAR